MPGCSLPAKARALGTAYAARHRRRGDRKMPSRPPLLTLMRSPYSARIAASRSSAFQTQIRHRDGFVGGELMRLHIPKRGAIAPSELALQPRQPVAKATPCLRVGQPPADLDHVVHHPLA